MTQTKYKEEAEKRFDKFTLDNQWASEHYNQLKFFVFSELEKQEGEMVKKIVKLVEEWGAGRFASDSAFKACYAEALFIIKA